MTVRSFGGEHFIKQFPSGASLLWRHFLNRIADMDQDEVAGRHWLILQQEQANLSFDTLGGTSGQKAIDSDHFHGNSQAHDLAPSQAELIYVKAAA
jgi:hypothetical protein